MTSEHRQDQACLYVAGALPAAEASAFEEAMRRDPALRALVEELRDGSELIALGIPQLPPPPGLKQKIFAQLDAAAAAPVVVAPDFKTNAPRILPLWMPLAMAASFILFAGVFLWNRHAADRRAAGLEKKIEALQTGAGKAMAQSATVQTQAGQIAHLQRQLEQSAERMLALSTQNVTLQTYIKQAEALKRDLDAVTRHANDLSNISEALRAQVAALQAAQSVSLVQIKLLKSLLENSPETVGVSVWDKENQKGVFVADKMPPLPDDKQYQLWIIDPKYTAPVSAGVFTVDPQGHARVEFVPTLPVDRSDHFAVSVERRGGAPQPEGRIVLLSQ